MKTIKRELVILLLFLMLTMKILVLCAFLLLKAIIHIPLKAMEFCTEVDGKLNGYMISIYKKHVNKSINQ